MPESSARLASCVIEELQPHPAISACAERARIEKNTHSAARFSRFVHTRSRLQLQSPAGATLDALARLKAGGREAPLGCDVPVVDLVREDLAPAEPARPLSERSNHATPHVVRLQVFSPMTMGRSFGKSVTSLTARQPLGRVRLAQRRPSRASRGPGTTRVSQLCHIKSNESQARCYVKNALRH